MSVYLRLITVLPPLPLVAIEEEACLSNFLSYFFVCSKMSWVSIALSTYSLLSLPVAYLIISVRCVSCFIGYVIRCVNLRISTQIMRNSMMLHVITIMTRLRNYEYISSFRRLGLFKGGCTVVSSLFGIICAMRIVYFIG
jgi:hypothetical protein